MNFKSDIDFDNTDDLDIMLPSQRKKQLQNQPNNGKTKKRPPKQKKMSMNPNLFDDEFMLDDAFQINSDDISPQNSDHSQFTNNNENDQSKKRSNNPISNLESSIKQYINNAINLLKQ